MTRDEALRLVAAHIQALTAGQRTSEKITRDPGPGADGIRRPSPEWTTWRVTHRGLIHQLVAALPPAAAPVSGGTGPGRKPGSRPPSAAAVSVALDDITREAGKLRDELRQGAARRVAHPRRTVVDDLLEIRALTHVVAPERAQETAQRLEEWVGWARSALALDAPVAKLRDVCCPYCGGALRVRSDASGDVWCATPGCADDNGGRPRWRRETWPFLLDEQTGGAA